MQCLSLFTSNNVRIPVVFQCFRESLIEIIVKVIFRNRFIRKLVYFQVYEGSRHHKQNSFETYVSDGRVAEWNWRKNNAPPFLLFHFLCSFSFVRGCVYKRSWIEVSVLSSGLTNTCFRALSIRKGCT